MDRPVMYYPRSGLAVTNGLVRPGPSPQPFQPMTPPTPSTPSNGLARPCGCNMTDFSFCRYPVSAYNPSSVAYGTTPCSLSFFGPTY